MLKTETYAFMKTRRIKNDIIASVKGLFMRYTIMIHTSFDSIVFE